MTPDEPGVVENTKQEVSEAKEMLQNRYEIAKSAGEANREIALAELETEDGRRQTRAEGRGEALDTGTDPLSGQFDSKLYKALRWAVQKQEVTRDKLAMDNRAQTMGGRLFTLVFGAVALGLTVIVLQLMILISGEFSAAIDGGGAFSDAANSTETNGNTAFDIMSTATLVIPVVVVVGLLIGAFLSSGGMGGIRNRVR